MDEQLRRQFVSDAIKMGIIRTDPLADDARKREIIPNKLLDYEEAGLRGKGETVFAEAKPYEGFWGRATQTAKEWTTLDQNVLTILSRKALSGKQIDPATGEMKQEEDYIKDLQLKREKDKYLLSGSEPPEGILEKAGDIVGVIAKEVSGPTAILSSPIGGTLKGLARWGALSAAGGIYEATSETAKQVAETGNIASGEEIAIRGGIGAIATPILDKAIRMGFNYAEKGTSSIYRKVKDKLKKDPFDAHVQEAVRRGILDGNKVSELKAEMQAGTSYVGFIDDFILSNTVKDKILSNNPIRREDILVPFAKKVGVTIYQGRIKSKTKKGYYVSNRQDIRIKNLSDIETAAHEIAHYIDDEAFNGFSKRKSGSGIGFRPWDVAENAKIYSAELKTVSYDETKIYEGFAEYVRLWMTQPENAVKAAPEFTKWWENFVQTDTRFGPALMEAKTGMLAYMQQGALNRLASKVGPQRALKEYSIADDMRASIFDDLHGVYKMETELKGGITEGGAYETARLTRAANSIAEGSLRLGKIIINEDGSHGYEGKGLFSILNPVEDDIGKWELYTLARSANELRKQGRLGKSPFTLAEINAGIDLETPAFKTAFDEYQVWKEATLDFAQSKGALNPQIRSLFNRHDYLPLFRTGFNGHGGGSKIPGSTKVTNRYKGSERNIASVIGNIIENQRFIIQKSLQNEARLKIAKMASTEKGGGKFMVPISKGTKVQKVDKEQLESYIYGLFGVTKKDIENDLVPGEMKSAIEQMYIALDNEPAYLDFWLRGQEPNDKTNVIAVLDKGKPKYYEVGDPLLFRAITSFNRPEILGIEKALNWFRRLGQATVTLTIDFMGANIARDTILASILSRNGFKPVISSLHGIGSRLAEDKNYRDAIANGLGMSSFMLDEGAFRKHLERYYSSKGINFKSIIDTPAKMLYALESIADAIEMSSRLGEVSAAIKAGKSKRHAAYLGREISTDFAMRGDRFNAVGNTMNVLYNSVMFVKPGMNGLDRIYRGFTKDPNKAAIFIKTGLLAVMSMGLYMVNRGNPLYEQKEDWEKDTHWFFYVPKKEYFDYVTTNGKEPENAEEYTGLFHEWKYPKIWEIGAIASIAERSVGAIMDKRENSYEDWELAHSTFRILKNMFNLDWVPQMLRGPYEVAINENRFTESPIQTQGMKTLPQWLRSRESTPKVLTKLGEASYKAGLPESLQINPVVGEHLIRSYFNTWGLYGLMISDALTNDNKPEMRVSDYPGLRRFYGGDQPARKTKYEDDFWEVLRLATETRRAMSLLEPTNIRLSDKLYKTEENKRYEELSAMNDYMGDIRKNINAVYADPMLTPEEKSRQIDALYLEKNRALKEIVDQEGN